MATGKTFAVKVPLRTLRPKDWFQHEVYTAAAVVNLITLHTYRFVGWLLLILRRDYPDARISHLVDESLFYEAFCAFSGRDGLHWRRIRWATCAVRARIVTYFARYCALVGFEPQDMGISTAIAGSTAKQMLHAFENKIRMTFGRRLRTLLEKRFDPKSRKEALAAAMQGRPQEEFRAACRAQIWEPLAKIREAAARWDWRSANTPPDHMDILDDIGHILDQGPEGDLLNDSRWYDAAALPADHADAAFAIDELLAEESTHAISPFPIRTTFVPRHFMIDDETLVAQFLGGGVTDDRPGSMRLEDTWGKVVNLHTKPIRRLRDSAFTGTAYTNGTMISLIFGTATDRCSGMHSRDGPVARGKRKERNILAADADNEPDCQYVEDMSHDDLEAIADRVVFIDPGRVDLLYFMHIKSTAKKPWCGKYTRRHRNAAIRRDRFRRIREEVLTPEVRRALSDLSIATHKAFDPDTYEQHLHVWGRHVNTLHRFYTETRTHTVENVHSRRQAAANDMAPVGAEGGVVIAGAGAAAGAGASGQDQPPLFPQLDHSMHLNVVREDKRLRRWVVKKFGKDAVFVFGNHSSPNLRFQEPVRGKHWRDLFRKWNFRVLLIDEFRTSSFCPECSSPVKKFRMVQNPRYWQSVKRAKRARKQNREVQEPKKEILCHGQLRCTNPDCLRSYNADMNQELFEGMASIPPPSVDGTNNTDQNGEPIKYRVFNRNLLGTLNMRHIFNGLLEHGVRPERFCRGTAIPMPRPDTDDDDDSDSDSDNNDSAPAASSNGATTTTGNGAATNGRRPLTRGGRRARNKTMAADNAPATSGSNARLDSGRMVQESGNNAAIALTSGTSGGVSARPARPAVRYTTTEPSINLQEPLGTHLLDRVAGVAIDDALDNSINDIPADKLLEDRAPRPANPGGKKRKLTDEHLPIALHYLKKRYQDQGLAPRTEPVKEPVPGRKRPVPVSADQLARRREKLPEQIPGDHALLRIFDHSVAEERREKRQEAHDRLAESTQRKAEALAKAQAKAQANKRTADSQASSSGAPAAKRQCTDAAKAPRKCSHCHQPGHDKRRCPGLNNTPGESS
ncbi:hypothetical protein H4R19_002471 [Coemansia spiralis]|nr:hypothetical protein H4R19_002471 [Coemansia spiralis]